MPRSVHGIFNLVRSYFVVYDAANAPVLGLVNGDFTKFLTFDGTVSAIVVTCTEIGSGKYMATYTPDDLGTWDLLIRNAVFNPRGWQETYDVTIDGLYSIQQITDDILNTEEVEVGFTVRNSLRVMSAALCGKASGGPAGSVFRNMPDTANRIVSVCNPQGDRTTVTLTP